jgi:hypothetical protein
MSNNSSGFARIAIVVILIAIPALFLLKYILGAHVPLISFKDKTLLYALVAVWNACFAYFIFRVI